VPARSQLRDDLRQMQRAVSDRRVQYTIVFGVCMLGVFVSVRLIYPTVFPSIVADLAISVLGAIFGVYISVGLLLPYVRHVERKRIMAADEIVTAYGHPDSFLTCPSIDSQNNTLPAMIPVAPAHLPNSLRSYDSFTYTIDTEDHYAVPDRLAALYEPDEQSIRELFQQEQRKNGRKARLDEVTDDTFELSVTTYYRSFLTNFCPDFPLSGGTTLRELTATKLLDGDDVRPLDETPFSDHFGGGLLAITTDGRALLPIRSRSVAVEGKALHVSCSGSFSLATIEDGGIAQVFREILTAETTIEASEIDSITYLGTTRRMERLGKPDTVAIAIVSETATLDIDTEQFVRPTIVDVLPPGYDSIDDVSTLFEPAVAAHIMHQLETAIDNSAYRPSIGLCSWLCLYYKLARQIESADEGHHESESVVRSLT